MPDPLTPEARVAEVWAWLREHDPKNLSVSAKRAIVILLDALEAAEARERALAEREGERASACVKRFHECTGQPISGSWGQPDRQALRRRLIAEEAQEFAVADEAGDLTQVADALADLLYVIHGTALEYGIPLDAVFAEVHRSNMTKLGPDGRPIVREDGKILKPPTWTPPDVAGILAGLPARPRE